MKAVVWVVPVFCISFGLGAQETKKVEPQYPAEASGLIYVEGEDAVSTNFAAHATLDYHSSGQRILQLNQPPQAPGAPFFADYVFLVTEAGDYEFWLGGTPLGPKEGLLPSYASPLTYRVDDQKPVPVYREDTNVVENYTINNYWSRIKMPLRLTEGAHTLRIEVSEKRRHDNNYYFFLDAFFLLKDRAAPPADAVPPAFPKNRANRSLDQYFLSVAQYESLIQNSPKILINYILLSKVYSLVGDFQNALKVLSRARVNVGSDPEILLLLAKNRIWSGEWQEGLKLFRDYLKLAPQDGGTWAEVGKSLAWLGQYPASLEMYLAGLKQFPEDLNLRVNLGLTYLWANRIREGEIELEQAWSAAQSDQKTVKQLGEIYQVNGYPGKATEVYRKAIPLFPRVLELYILLENSLAKQGQTDQAAEIHDLITQTFLPSDRLQTLLDGFRLKQRLKQITLEAYETRLAAQPDDLNLRETLVQAYFWNGLSSRAIEETKSILVNRLFRRFELLNKELEPTYHLMDMAYAAKRRLSEQDRAQAGLSQTLGTALAQWRSADQAVQTKPDEAKTAKWKETQESLAKAVGQAEALHAAVLQSITLVEDWMTRAQTDLARVAGERANLGQVQPWAWNRQTTLTELTHASQAGVSLADYLLGRLLMNEQNPTLASVYVSRLERAENPPPSFTALRLQAGLWRTGIVDAVNLTQGPYFAYAPALIKAFSPLPESEEAPLFSEQTPARAQELTATLSTLPAQVAAQRTTLDAALSSLHTLVMLRTQIHFYQNDLETHDLRYQLASYLLDANAYKEAREQLERLLVLNPGNVLTRFNLGRARQLSGDWSGAMQLYREVYQTDPQFESAATSYNQLAQAHSDHVATRFTSFTDNSRATTQGQMDYHRLVSSWFSVDARYQLDSVRVYQQTLEVVPSKASLQTLSLSPTISLTDLHLDLTAKVGGTWHNKLQDAYLGIGESALPSDLFTKYSAVSPLLGAGLSWGLGPLTLDGDYTFGQIQDTFLVVPQVYYEHRWETTSTLYWAFASPLVLRGIGSRTYLRVSDVFGPFVDTTNRLYSALEEVNAYFAVAEQPPTSVTLSGTATWDHSDNPSEVSYYAPNQAVTLKGGLGIQTDLSLGGGWVLGLSGRAAGGTTSNATTSDLLSEGSVRLEGRSGELVLFLEVASSVSQGTEIDYWTTQLVLGATLGLPDYIIK